MRKKNSSDVPASVDDYLAQVPEPAHSTLKQVRKVILANVPEGAEERISYRVPSIFYGGVLLHFAAFEKHCSLFPGPGVIEMFAEELQGYETSKGTIRFPADKPMPAALIKKLVQARVAQQEARLLTKKQVKRAPWGAKGDPEVLSYLAALDHPLKPVLEAVRKLILTVSPKIQEGIKWNAPSFRTSEYFATFNLRDKGGEERLWLILHTGAKGKAGAVAVADPQGLLEWVAKDRCVVKFQDLRDVKARSAALKAILREWIA